MGNYRRKFRDREIDGRTDGTSGRGRDRAGEAPAPVPSRAPRPAFVRPSSPFSTPIALLLSVPQPIIPEVIEPDEKLPRDLVALRNFARIMDEAIKVPGTPLRFGLDALVGLIPGIGDAIGGAMASWIVLAAIRHRVPFRKIVRMLFNVVVDMVLGAVPVAGDIFDFLFEENVANMKILIQYRDRRRPPRSWGQIWFAASAVVAFVLFVAFAAVAGMVALLVWITARVGWM